MHSSSQPASFVFHSFIHPTIHLFNCYVWRPYYILGNAPAAGLKKLEKKREKKKSFCLRGTCSVERERCYLTTKLQHLQTVINTTNDQSETPRSTQQGNWFGMSNQGRLLFEELAEEGGVSVEDSETQKEWG